MPSSLQTLDWVVIGLYFAITIGVGLSFAHKAGRGVEDFFLAGRKLTWWMAGGSMVATMFASDTPLFHCGNVRDSGLSAGTLFVLPMFGALAAAAVFARLVRRTGVITDAEFIELRYSGKTPAPFRAFLACYSGVFVASLTMGWVTLGMVEVTSQLLGWEKVTSTVIVLALVTVYSMASGMWGVVMTDMFQYAVAALGSLILAVMAVGACGGLEGLRTKLAAIPGYSGADMHLIPTGHERIYSYVVHPGSHPSDAIYVTLGLVIASLIVQSIAQASSTAHQGQRVLACKTERDASLTYVFYSVCYYALNGLSWIVVGLASIIVLGATNQQAHLANSQRAFPAMIAVLMPVGMKGLMLASIFAAFMSTVSVLLNWGSSYLVNDLYRRFLVTQASQRHYVWVSRVASLAVAVIGGVVCMGFRTLADMFAMVPMFLTGAVVVLLARYVWWRTNIWSEVSAMVSAPFIGFYIEFVIGGRGQVPILQHLPLANLWYDPNMWVFFGHRLLATVALTTVCWIAVTLLTPPTDMEKLKDFYMKVRPTGPGWAYVRRQFETPPQVESGWVQLGVWVSSVAFLVGLITSAVMFIRGDPGLCVVWAAIGVAGAVIMMRLLAVLDRQAVSSAQSHAASLESKASPMVVEAAGVPERQPVH